MAKKLPNKGTFFVTKQGNLMVRRGAAKKGTWVSLSPRECKTNRKKGESKKACAKRVFAKKGIVFGTFGGKKKSSGKLTYAARKKMAPGKFVFPKGTKADPGKKKFPIPDLAHGRQALARAAQKRTKLTQDERCKVVRAVCRKFKSLREHKGSVCGGNRDRRLIGQCMSRSR